MGSRNRKALYYIGGRKNAGTKMRRNFCQACSFARGGVKTRIAIPHTCGGQPVMQKPTPPYIPKREELDMYIARLKELMEPDDFTGARNPEL